MRHSAPRPVERATIHDAQCRCDDCNPPVPSIPERLLGPVEVLGGIAFGLLNAWILDRLLDGPGIQILFGY